jgi:hypothetical protein
MSVHGNEQMAKVIQFLGSDKHGEAVAAARRIEPDWCEVSEQCGAIPDASTL